MMPGLVALLLAAGAVNASAAPGGIRWERSLEEGLHKAQWKQRPVMVDFWAEWCTWCHRLEATTYREPDVVEAAKDFVAVRVNTEGTAKDKLVAMKYGVSTLPTVLFLTPEGRQILRIDGFQGPGVFPETLARARELAAQVMDWEATLARNPKDAAALAAMGDHLYSQEYYAEARELLLASTRHDARLSASQRRRTRMTLAVIENSEREYAEAESLLREALNLGPSDAEAPTLLYILGRTYASWGRPTDAQEMMQTILRDHSASPIAQKARETLTALQRQP